MRVQEETDEQSELLARIETAFKQTSTSSEDFAPTQRQSHIPSRFVPNSNVRMDLDNRDAGLSTRKPVARLNIRPLLTCHLNELHQRKQRHDLEIVEHYWTALKALSASRAGRSEEVVTTPPRPSPDVAGLNGATKESIQALEKAVVQARSNAAHEKDLVRSSEGMVKGDRELTISHQLRALAVVRKELTEWLEETLLLCGGEDTINEQETEEEVQAGLTPIEDFLQAHQQYNEARLNLILALNSIPHISLDDEDDGDSDERTRKPWSQIDDLALRAQQGVTAEETHAILRQSQAYLATSLQSESEATVELLRRLTDESHLIPSYPILATSEKFSNARRVFGNVQAHENSDTVTDQIQKWIFAAGAASEASQANLEQYLKLGFHTINEAEGNSQELLLLKDLSAGT